MGLPVGSPGALRSSGRNGDRPIHIAAEKGRLDVIKLLLKRRARIEVRDTKARSPLHLAALHGRLEIVKFLISTDANIDAMGNFSETPLHLASRYGHVEVVRALIKAEAGTWAQDDSLHTALHWAALNGHTEICRLLLKAEAEIDEKTWAGKTPLIYAASGRRPSWSSRRPPVRFRGRKPGDR